MVRVAKEAVCEGEDGIRVEGAADSDVTLDLGRLRAVFRAPTDLELVLPLQVLERYLLGDGRRGGGVEIGLAGGRAGDHLAALGEADDKIVDVEALVVVVLATLGACEIAGPAGDAVDPVDAIAVCVPLGGVERPGGAEIDPQLQVGLSGPFAQIDTGLPPYAVAVELLHVLIGEEGGIG